MGSASIRSRTPLEWAEGTGASLLPSATQPLRSLGPMQLNHTHPISENEIYLKLFITNGGGW